MINTVYQVTIETSFNNKQIYKFNDALNAGMFAESVLNGYVSDGYGGGTPEITIKVFKEEEDETPDSDSAETESSEESI